MRPKKQIPVKAFLADMHGGMTDQQLMEKYKVSSRGLQRVFRKLLDADAITPAQLRGRVPSFEDTVSLDFENLRFPSDEHLECLVPVYDETAPSCVGSLCEIGDNGLTIEGLTVEPGQVRRIVVAAHDFFQIDSFTIELKCKWAKPEEPGKPPVAAFEIASIAESDKPNLRSLERLVKIHDKQDSGS
jgi:hypothetical protein